MGFFSRLFNVISGFFSSFIGKVEERNPELVYEAAIQERLKKQKELKKLNTFEGETRIFLTFSA